MIRSKQALATEQHYQQPAAVGRRRDQLEEIFQECQFRSRRERADTARFLKKHSFLIPILLEAIPRIRHTFGSETVVFLSLVVDPEDEDFEELLISILTDKPTETALDLLNQFDEEWFVGVLPHTKNLLNVTIESKHAL